MPTNPQPTGPTDNLIIVKHSPLNAEAPLTALKQTCTPTELFFVRSNFGPPSITPQDWKLNIDGALDNPFELTLNELRSLPATTLTAMLECAGNNRTLYAPLPKGEPWGAGALSMAEWRGVPLPTVLQQAGLRSTAIEVMFEGADRGTMDGNPDILSFGRSLPLDKALHPDTLLVYEMNGLPLPPEHGGPVRLLVPDWYGMASVKWLTHIAALEQPFTGFFQTKRYVLDLPGSITSQPVREMRVKSLITSPSPGATLPQGPYTITGLAWSGAGAIRSVEISVEGGGAWNPANLIGQAPPHHWQQWQYQWNPTHPGRHVLRARATDEHNTTQPDAAPWNRLGYTNNAIQPVTIQVLS